MALDIDELSSEFYLQREVELSAEKVAGVIGRFRWSMHNSLKKNPLPVTVKMIGGLEVRTTIVGCYSEMSMPQGKFTFSDPVHPDSHLLDKCFSMGDGIRSIIIHKNEAA